jgi:hypothetical protein
MLVMTVLVLSVDIFLAVEWGCVMLGDHELVVEESLVLIDSCFGRVVLMLEVVNRQFLK